MTDEAVRFPSYLYQKTSSSRLFGRYQVRRVVEGSNTVTVDEVGMQYHLARLSLSNIIAILRYSVSDTFYYSQRIHTAD